MIALALALMILVPAAVLGAGVYVASRIASSALALVARKLDLDERTVAMQEQRTRSVRTPSAMPSDLVRRITKWHDEQAQAMERKVILDLYAEFQESPDPWLEVRNHLPAEPRDDLPDTPDLGLVA